MMMMENSDMGYFFYDGMVIRFCTVNVYTYNHDHEIKHCINVNVKILILM